MNAVKIKNLILGCVSIVSSVVANALGGWDDPLKLLVCLMGADFITGLLIAVVWKKSPKTETGKASSSASFKGLVKKAVVLLVVWVAVQLDNSLNITYVRLAVIVFFSGNEGLSLLENLGIMGVPYPQFIKNMFEALHEKGNEGKEQQA